MNDYSINKELEKLKNFDLSLHDLEDNLQGFQKLMKLRIRDILLVSSLYDLYLFEEDGRLYELVREEYQGLSLSHSPELTRVSRGKDAIELAKNNRRFDLIITTMHIEDMSAVEFAKKLREAGINLPLVLLTNDNKELKALLIHQSINMFDKVFAWQGDFRIIIGIIKYFEDRLNIEHDTKTAGVQVILYVEDNVQYYSSILPILYTDLFKQSQRLISEGISLSHKFLRMRARPKIILCSNYEEAWKYYKKYNDFILGVISDIDFPQNNKANPKAGLLLAKNIKKDHYDIPVLLLSNLSENKSAAENTGASFILKDSPVLMNELREFMNEYFSFGDFVFRDKSGNEVGRACDLKSLEEQLKIVPDESILYHSERNHFSNWLKARTEFWLAHQLRPRRVSDYPSVKELRKDLINSLRFYKNKRQRGFVTDFNKDSFDPMSSFARIGGGSLGGKARGLSFVNSLITNYNIRNIFPGVNIFVPPGIVLSSQVFDFFIDKNNLKEFALNSSDDREITKRFIEASVFQENVLSDLYNFLELIDTPLAVRSSSLLEDSQYLPFAGVYQTYMLPNNQENIFLRLDELLRTIKKIYASTFYANSKAYFKATSYRLEEEKMAVIIQKLVGKKYNNRFYPSFSGVAKSYNYYPLPPQLAKDGIASVALGLGKTVVDGGNCVRFCPKYPTDLIQFYSVKEALNSSQKTFFALNLQADKSTDKYLLSDNLVCEYDLEDAEKDGTLNYLGATYSVQDDIITDGLSRKGPKVVTFGTLLKAKLIPLPEILELLLSIGTKAMGTPIEIEFAVNLPSTSNEPVEFGFLQLRPLVVNLETVDLRISSANKKTILCYSNRVLGNGVIEDIYDIVFIDYTKFNRKESRTVAAQISQLNETLVSENRPYLLVGVGRWGSLDPWLGIPVRWENISGAKAIVETTFKDFSVTPSQGSHFFQNITSFMVGYFTIEPESSKSFIDWNFLLQQKAVWSSGCVNLLKFSSPVIIKMNGQNNSGIILKPGLEE